MLRVSLLLLCVLVFSTSYAQRKKKSKSYFTYDVPQRPSENERFLRTQWWLGFKAGVNTSIASPEQRYGGFSAINGENTYEKDYEDFGHLSGHSGIVVTFYHKGFSFSFEPNYRRQTFAYSNNFEWVDSNNPDNSLVLQYDQNHLLDYLEFPIFIKYDITQTKFRPFIQVGAYYGRLMSAEKSVEISGTDFASGNESPFETQTIRLGVDDLFKKQLTGIIGGIGFSYDFWNIRLVFDANYRYGLNNITLAENRYEENQLSGIGDSLDDINLRNISISLGTVFPLRFISENYKSTN